MSEKIPSQDTEERRSHTAIVTKVTVPVLLKLLSDRGFPPMSASAVQRWAYRDSIPAPFWHAIADEGFATLSELAAHADRKVTQNPAAEQQAETEELS